MSEIIHKQLSYTVRGVLLSVYNQLGPMLPEKFYQAAIAIGLTAAGIQNETEKGCEVYYRGVEVGRYYVDIWIEGGKLLLELKVAPNILPLHRAQALSYLKVTNADLAIVVNFGAASLEDERLPNYLRERKRQSVWQQRPFSSDVLYPELASKVMQVLFRVCFELGPGFFHQVYRRATMIELREQNIGYPYIKEIPIFFKGQHLGNQPVRLIVVEDKILVATVALRTVDAAMEELLKARLRQLGYKLALIANFYTPQLQVTFLRQS